MALKSKNNYTGKIWDKSDNWFKSYGQNVSKEPMICGAGVRPTFRTEPEPNVRLSSVENSSGSRTVLLSLGHVMAEYHVMPYEGHSPSVYVILD